MGLYAANTTGDGNCLFRALSDQLYGYPGHHGRLRQETCDHLASQPDRFAGFVDDKPFEEYVRLMRESGTYGGHLELHAFAQMKQKQIKIVQPGLVYIVSGDDDSPEAIRAREQREKERLRMQNSVQPGAQGPPPTDRQQRRMKREENRHRKKLSTHRLLAGEETDLDTGLSDNGSGTEQPEQPSGATTPLPPPSDVLIEAYGPLYIAYHNWEHYSSVRNLEGPHTGLPRIKEHPLPGTDDAENAQSGSSAQAQAESSEPTEEEKMVMQSTTGNHSLAEIRRLMQEHSNDWAHVVEVLIERDTIIEEQAVGAELQAIPSSEDSTQQSGLVPPSSLPDHMRQWRATSPASVDTSATHSSGEGGSPSTHATTEEGNEPPCPSPEYLHGDASSMDRLSAKRAASVDLSSTRNLRSPKRYSRSRSPEKDGSPQGTCTDHASSSHAESSVSSPTITPSEPEQESAPEMVVREEYEIIKRGRGRPRKDGLPNKSSIAIKRKVLTPREKRDAAVARKREREMEKVKARNSAAAAPTNSASSSSVRPNGEVKGFRELKI